jgi:hypothetical protein
LKRKWWKYKGNDILVGSFGDFLREKRGNVRAVPNIFIFDAVVNHGVFGSSRLSAFSAAEEGILPVVMHL